MSATTPDPQTGTVRQFVAGIQILAARHLPYRLYQPAGWICEQIDKQLKARESRRGKCSR